MHLTPESLVVLCGLLFLDGATLAVASTVLVLTYGRYHEPWAVAAAGGLSAALGSTVQLALLRWALHSGQPWMKRFAPSRERIDTALKSYPAATFLGLLVARATPLPDAPLKLVAAVVGYPLLLYGLASFLGTVPYFFVLALLGRKFRLPLWLLVSAVALIVVGVLVDRLVRARRSAAPSQGTGAPP